MKQTIPFKKDITFKTKIGELTAISLDNDLTLKGEDLIVGNFYISGKYKMLESSSLEESYSYKIPCEIAISDDYDTYDATIDIDDFYYEIIDDEILRVNIIVIINNLKRKELEEEVKDERVVEKEDLGTDFQDEIEVLDVQREDINPIMEVKKQVKSQKETYLTYKVYIFKETDTISDILEKYNITKEQLSDYNNLDEIQEGSKIVIPSFND
ncbi:MAG: LysM peptidoglycan-binding domain-containing protein [bacterium]|nr:LysM peptidoglycan-binding domain-containing protein [bacterium]